MIFDIANITFFKPPHIVPWFLSAAIRETENDLVGNLQKMKIAPNHQPLKSLQSIYLGGKLRWGYISLYYSKPGAASRFLEGHCHIQSYKVTSATCNLILKDGKLMTELLYIKPDELRSLLIGRKLFH